MPYIIVRETDTGVLVEGLCYGECSETAALSQVNMMTSFEHFFIILIHSKIDMEIRDEANLRFVFDTDVNSLINVLETRGKTKRNFFEILFWKIFYKYLIVTFRANFKKVL